MKKQNHSNRPAFTLIELLVVISIIAVLAGIALPVYGNVLAKSRVTTASNHLKQLGLGVAAYLNDNDEDMIKGDGTWEATTDGKDGLVGKYLGQGSKILQAPWDKRVAASLAKFPVSYSFNQGILRPTKASAPGEWNGNMSQLASPSSTIMAAPNYQLGDGDPAKQASWGTDSVNIGTSVMTIPSGGGNIGGKGGRLKGLPGNGNRTIVLYCDSHVATIAILADSGAANPDNFRDKRNWEPLGSKTTPTP